MPWVECSCKKEGLWPLRAISSCIERRDTPLMKRRWLWWLTKVATLFWKPSFIIEIDQTKMGLIGFYLCQWKGKPTEENSWQQGTTLWQFEDMINTYNSFQTKRGRFLQRWGNVTHLMCWGVPWLEPQHTTSTDWGEGLSRWIEKVPMTRVKSHGVLSLLDG